MSNEQIFIVLSVFVMLVGCALFLPPSRNYWKSLPIKHSGYAFLFVGMILALNFKWAEIAIKWGENEFQMTQLKAQLSQAETEIQKKERELDSVISESERENEALKSEIASLKSNIENLNSDVFAYKNSLTRYEQSVNKLIGSVIPIDASDTIFDNFSDLIPYDTADLSDEFKSIVYSNTGLINKARYGIPDANTVIENKWNNDDWDEFAGPPLSPKSLGYSSLSTALGVFERYGTELCTSSDYQELFRAEIEKIDSELLFIEPIPITIFPLGLRYNIPQYVKFSDVFAAANMFEENGCQNIEKFKDIIRSKSVPGAQLIVLNRQ